MLEMLDLPAYYRMRAWLLLAASVQDRELAETYMRSVQHHLNYARSAKEEGQDPELDEGLEDLRETLEAVKDHWAEQPSADEDTMDSETIETSKQAATSASSKAPMVDIPSNSGQVQKIGPALPTRPRYVVMPRDIIDPSLTLVIERMT